MKKMNRLTALLVCIAMVFSLAACTTDSPEPTTVPTEPQPTAQELYAAAVQLLDDSEHVRLQADISRSTAVGTDVYTKNSQQQFTWKGLGTDNMQAKITDSSTIGDITTRSTEVYRDGAVYLTMEGNAYVSDMAAADFTARWIPTVPLTDSLYADITAEENADGTLLRFEDPSAVETWAAPEYARLISASGTAQLNAEGAFTAFTYEAVFTLGGAEITLNADVTMLKADALDLTLVYPEDDERYVLLETPEIPLLLNDVWGYLAQFQSGSATLTQTFSSDALASSCVIALQQAAHGGLENHQSSVEQLISITAYDGEEIYDSFSYTREDTFLDGVYTMRYDDEDPETDDAVDAETMHNFCFSNMVTNYPYMSEITGGTLTDFGGICLLELDASTALAQSYSKTVCEYLADDPNYLDLMATSYKTNTMDYYWAINRDTGLPTASGITFTGTHTIDGQPYDMSFQSNQTYYLADPGAYEAVTGEPLPEETPTETPTPVFYHVTGTEGQEMWLLGTIHVGDERTGAMPQEIYDALNSSAALAVEFDSENFLQSMAEDPDLIARVLRSYYYLDGTTTADHLDPNIYAAGSKLLKATGTNASEAMLMKPYLWSQTIDGLYLQLGYSLVSEKGVDNRLMDYARENGITIKDVESGIFQVELLGGFSDALQELLLSESIDTPAAVSNHSTQDLYEMWCAGDEAELIEYLTDDTSDMTKQEQALYNEYNKAISTDRNADMLEVAKGYLESGEVIFYAVGLAHLLVEDGLVNTLRDAGYTVELVSYGG